MVGACKGEGSFTCGIQGLKRRIPLLKGSAFKTAYTEHSTWFRFSRALEIEFGSERHLENKISLSSYISWIQEKKRFWF